MTAIPTSLDTLPDSLSASTSLPVGQLASSPDQALNHLPGQTELITSTVVIGLVTVGIVVLLCRAISAYYKYRVKSLGYKHEEKKREDEDKTGRYNDKVETAWRYLNDFYKNKDKGSLTDDEKKMAECSLKFLIGLMEEKTSNEKEKKE